MTRISLIAITISLIALGGCSVDNTEPLSGGAVSNIQTPSPESSASHTRILPPANFTDESRETFCNAVEEGIEKRASSDARDFGPDYALSEYGKALYAIHGLAAPEEKEAWLTIAQQTELIETKDIEHIDTIAYMEAFRDLRLTVDEECGLPMP